MKLEDELREDFRKRYDGAFDTFEPSLGTGTGYPDCQIWLDANLCCPVEFKRAEMIKGSIKFGHVRPSQVSWHTRFNMIGRKSWFIFGTKELDGQLNRYIVEAMFVLANREKLVSLEKCHLLPISEKKKDDSLFSSRLRKFLEEGLFKK